ncbi:PREDICTED: protein PFC0760c [Ceratosolen solmsi marchali]|uniref:Protein PFC0760c n=1 Tax=Ceratosolen solmsi marchali TaxID=326594 RepID=A0AAJ7DVM6_9HYME|nr:PREDICTED: protein PFC0760c [Ceratosolen solmsi marchali]
MRLSTILELLLIFLLVAFAAYGRVIERNIHAIDTKISSVNSSTSLKQATENVNKYCTCNENICNCCRDFHIPLVQLSGPGCASLQYLQDDKLAMQLNIGDNILSSNIINGKNPKPVCVTLPGGFSKFCGKIYSIKRDADKHFKACLGLELRSVTELEASLRVSCFRFGPDGLKLRPAEPLPATIIESASDDDYDDIFGLSDDEDDDDDDEDYEKINPENNVVFGISSNKNQALEQEEEDEDDLLGFGALFDIFTGEDDSSRDKKIKVTSTQSPNSFIIPILPLASTVVHTITESPVSKNPISTIATIEPIVSSIITSSSRPLDTSTSNLHYKTNFTVINLSNDSNIETTYYPLKEILKENTEKTIYDSTTYITGSAITESNNISEENDINNLDNIKIKKIKSKTTNKKIISGTSQNVNTINNNIIKLQQTYQSSNDDPDNDYDFDSSQEYESNENDENNKTKIISSIQNEKEDNNNTDKHVDSDEVPVVDEVDYEEDDDNDDETEVEDEEDNEEEAVIDAFLKDGHNKSNNQADKYKKNKNKIIANKTNDLQEYDNDYTYELTDLLARKQHSLSTIGNKNFARKIARRSKVMKFSD